MPESDQAKVIVHFHGGGFKVGSADTHRGLGANLASYTGCRVLLPNYRLAPENPFPAALLDAKTVYFWLLEEGYLPQNIILSGDSAGGGLAVACAQALRDEQEAPLPAGIVCLSPWVDLRCKARTYKSKDSVDPLLSHTQLKELAQAYAAEDSAKNPYISPLLGSFKRLPPMLIQVGSDEVLLDDSRKLARNAEADGVEVMLSVWPGMWHVWQMFGEYLPESAEALKRIAEFCQTCFAKNKL